MQTMVVLQEAGSGIKSSNGTGEMTLQLVDGKFRDSRWQDGRWVLDKFKGGNGSMDWDKVCPSQNCRVMETHFFD